MVSRQEKTQQALVAAATRLFSAYGVRRTAMEQIAQEAQVAKATAYAYFPNKDAVFVAVVDAVIAQLEEVTRVAAEAAPDPAAAVRDSMLAKYALEWKLVHGSPHARELLAASQGLAAEAMQAAHARHAKQLAQWLVRAGVRRGEAAELAETLDDAFEGLAAGAQSLEQLESRGALLLRRVLGG
ncbi:helix-turn-helix domain-containing protein [Corallococcus exercitus]|uniref:TetR/AcrR family transcriptional regulator n=1 Tax=Corallococcus exercitus TaxID=2316736 RepID=A0A7Y4JRB6_9BACT|nr:TetR/AcrR family transcriptional regulator [Corallococcus exercitus]NOK09750.1 TetR/AcrR family transcriptional regulator [Corallococcus exercitus]